jgi:hypothetical protein
MKRMYFHYKPKASTQKKSKRMDKEKMQKVSIVNNMVMLQKLFGPAFVGRWYEAPYC